MAVLLVIPARYASTRYPGKPLAELVGATGEARSLIRRSWEAAGRSPGVDRVVVATDDDRIAAAARGFGAEVAMTPGQLPQRHRALRRGRRATFGGAYDIVVNLQGDAPLTPPWFVSALVEAMQADRTGRWRRRCCAATPRRWRASSRTAATAASAPPPRSSTATAGRSTSPRRCSPTPAVRSAPGETIPVFHHVGVYAYRPAALDRLSGLAGRPARDLGGAGAAPLHGERRAGPLRRGRGPRAAPSGSSTIRRTCRGSRRSPPARPALSSAATSPLSGRTAIALAFRRMRG